MTTVNIKTPSGLIAGFSSAHRCVQVAGAPGYEKAFANRAAAERFIKRYGDAGYGLSASDCEIIEAK